MSWGAAQPQYCSKRTGIQRSYGWAVLLCIAIPATASTALAQDDASVPVIRIEAREVLVPVRVSAWVDRGHVTGYPIVKDLTSHDFHLYEDGKEQSLESVTLARPNGGDVADSVAFQWSVANTPSGKWVKLRDIGGGRGPLAPPLFVLAYRLPGPPDGSCHDVKVTVNAKDENGRSTIRAESNLVVTKEGFRTYATTADRRNLRLFYSKQYCSVAHAGSDPLYGTPIDRKLEDAAGNDAAKQNGFWLSAVELFGSSTSPHVLVTLDFPNLPARSGIPGFPVSLLGLFRGASGDPVARFSDSTREGCPAEAESMLLLKLACDRFFDHYETEADLPPGDYDLRAVIDFGGTLRRAEVPVHVSAPENHMAVSGIALCTRYFRHGQPLPGPQPESDGIPTMPFELTPLVSKGIEFTPTAMSHFKNTDPAIAYFELYEPQLGKGDKAGVKFEMRVVDSKSGEVKSDTGYRPADDYENSGKAVIPIAQKIAIGDLAPGEYQIHVRATDSTGFVTHWRSTSFTRE